MKNKNIDDILSRYWKAETTLEEEEILRRHFAAQPERQEHDVLFHFFNKERDRKLDKDLQFRPKVVAFNFRYVLSIAASMLVIVASYFLLNPVYTTGSSNINQIEDPEQALEVTLEALSFLDQKLTKGEAVVMENIKLFDKTFIFKS